MSHDMTPFAVGARVRVTDGPFDGFEAEVAQALPEDRYDVVVTLLGRPVPILVERFQIAAR